MFDMAGDDAVQFGLGEPDFQPPDIAIEAFSKAMKDGHNKYTTTAGLPALRLKIAEGWQHLVPSLDASSVCMTMSEPTLSSTYSSLWSTLPTRFFCPSRIFHSILPMW